MTPREQATLNFWHAAILMRRAPDREQSTAVKIVVRLSASRYEPLRQRAVEIMRGLSSDQSSRHV